MGRKPKPPRPAPPAETSPAPRSDRVELHGWDSRGRAWHGPDELSFSLAGCRKLLARLGSVPGSWHGRLKVNLPGELPVQFCASAHDLGDSALAVLDVEGSPGGPVEIILVVPSQRRARLRPDMAFEFVSFLRFLEGAASLGSELAIHDYVQQALAETPAGTTLIFSIESGYVTPDVHLLVAHQAEQFSLAMIGWMAEKDDA